MAFKLQGLRWTVWLAARQIAPRSVFFAPFESRGLLIVKRLRRPPGFSILLLGCAWMAVSSLFRQTSVSRFSDMARRSVFGHGSTLSFWTWLDAQFSRARRSAFFLGVLTLHAVLWSLLRRPLLACRPHVPRCWARHCVQFGFTSSGSSPLLPSWTSCSVPRGLVLRALFAALFVPRWRQCPGWPCPSTSPQPWARVAVAVVLPVGLALQFWAPPALHVAAVEASAHVSPGFMWAHSGALAGPPSLVGVLSPGHCGASRLLLAPTSSRPGAWPCGRLPRFLVHCSSSWQRRLRFRALPLSSSWSGSCWPRAQLRPRATALSDCGSGCSLRYGSHGTVFWHGCGCAFVRQRLRPLRLVLQVTCRRSADARGCARLRACAARSLFCVCACCCVFARFCAATKS
jgi:hypothetical protein